MKKLIIVVVAIALLSSCGEKSNFSISGNIEGGDGKMLYLNELLVSSQKAIDSVKIDKKGNFEIKSRTSIPTFYLLKLSETKFITLIADSTDVIEVTGTYNNLHKDYKVKGSEGSLLIQDLNQQFAKTKSKMDSISSLYDSNKNDKNLKKQLADWDNEYLELAKDYSVYAETFVKEHPFSMANIVALYQRWDDGSFVIQNLHSMKVAASALTTMYPESNHAKSLYRNTIKIIQDQKSSELSSFLESKAVNSPDIVLPDPNGKEIALSSLRGKYVLLHFWSAKDRGSRMLNPVLVENYKIYKRKGLELYMVSVDDDKLAWTQAIKEDGLNCINVGDMKGSISAVNKYNIRVLPSNYLLDKEGQILAKDLAGPALGQALKSVLK
jgi:peroxiredoxin